MPNRTGVIILGGCKIQAPMFAPIEDVLNLSPGMTFDQVVSKMKMNPYDILINQGNSAKIYTYCYRNIERKVGPSAYNQRGHEKEGRERYNQHLQTCFLVFDSLGKLETITSTRGRLDANNLLLINNTVYVVSKDRNQYNLTPLILKNGTIEEEMIIHKKKKGKK